MTIGEMDDSIMDSLKHTDVEDEYVEDEYLEDEIDDSQLMAYDMAVFYNTYNLSTIIKWWGKKLEIPSFQRSYIWTQRKASEFVDSILRGLPVPSLFFYDDRENSRLLVIDGLQRLKSLYLFIKEKEFNGRVFKLNGSIHPKWAGMSYDELEQEDKERLDDALINVTLMRQLSPDDGSSSMYLAFQRLNTGGVTLSPQEIRMAISYGPLAIYLDSLARDNRFDKWPFLRSKSEIDNGNYSKIQELILRFWAYYYSYPCFYGGSVRVMVDSFFDENKFFDEKKTGDRIHSKQEFEDAFNAAFDIVNRLSIEDLSPYTKPTKTFLETIWVGLTYRVLVAKKEVNEERLPNYISNWRNVIGEEQFSEFFQARRSSSIQSVYARIKAGIEYFIEDF